MTLALADASQPAAALSDASPTAGSPAEEPSALPPTTTAAQRFEAANAAFAAGRYAEAREGFEQVLREDGASPSVLFNLGNASFRAGRIADAILAYERALLLAPRDQDVRANLRQARNAAELPNDDGGAWGRLVGLATIDGWAWLASGGLWLLCGALIALRLLRGTTGVAARRALRGIVACAAALVVVASAACATRLRDRDRAVVLATDPVLRVAPYESATAAAELVPGDVVRIERMHDGFALVRTRDGKTGWMADGAVARIASIVGL